MESGEVSIRLAKRSTCCKNGPVGLHAVVVAGQLNKTRVVSFIVDFQSFDAQSP